LIAARLPRYHSCILDGGEDNLAASKGDEDGRKNRDMVAKKMTPTQIAEAQRLSREWLEKHGE
jgi:hypothetical protein